MARKAMRAAKPLGWMALGGAITATWMLGPRVAVNRRQQVGELFDVIGQARTGLVAGLLLGLVGVPAETVAADYAMTGEALRPQLEAWLETVPTDYREIVRVLLRPMSNTMPS